MPLLPAKKLLDNFRCWLHADDGKGNMSEQGIRVVKLPNHELMETVANRIIEFKDDGKYIDKMTTYEEYLKINK